MTYMGKIPPKPDGTEGYASITLTLKKPDCKIETIACFIKNDEQLQDLQRENRSDLYVKTHKDTKFFLYFFCSQSNLLDRLVESEIVAHRYTKPTKDKNCKIENKLETQPFFLRDNHVFLPACDEVFTTPDFEIFLTKHSSAVTIKTISVGKYRGVQNSNAQVKYFSFSLSSSNGTLNIPIPAYDVFNNLVDGPLLLFEEASKKWKLIGWYNTTPEKNRIIVYNLIAQDTTDICEAPKSYQTDGSKCLPKQSVSAGPHTSTDQTNQSVSADPPTSTDQSIPSGSTDPPTSTDQSVPSVSTDPPTSTDQSVPSGSTGPPTSTNQSIPSVSADPPTSTDQSVPSGSTGPPKSTDQSDQSGSDTGVSNNVQDPVSHSQPIQNSMPPPLSSNGANGQQILQNQPTENSMQYNPPIQSSDSNVVLSSDSVNVQQALQDLLNNDYVVDYLAINLDKDYTLLTNWRHLAKEMGAPQDIKDKCNCNTVHSPTLTFLERPEIRNKTIQELMNAAAKRKDVLNILEEKFSEEGRKKSIEDVFLSHPELMDEIATKLDRKPSSHATKNWKDIGKSLGLDEDELDLIENGGHNPAEELLLYAYSSLPPAKTKAKEFRRIIMEFTKRKDLHKLLDTLGITENNDRPLKNVIPPNSENMKKMTAALNRCPPGLQNWKNLASSWGCKYVLFDYPAQSSPTKTLLEWVRDSMDHEVTVDEFINILGEKMARYDVKQELEEVIEKNR